MRNAVSEVTDSDTCGVLTAEGVKGLSAVRLFERLYRELLLGAFAKQRASEFPQDATFGRRLPAVRSQSRRRRNRMTFDAPRSRPRDELGLCDTHPRA
jgi:hypothetical protein